MRTKKPTMPPSKPEQVQRVEAELRAQREAMLMGLCRFAAWKGEFPLWRSPEGHGAQLADLMMVDALERQREQQSKIVIPKLGGLVQP